MNFVKWNNLTEKLFYAKVWNYMSNGPQFSKYIWIDIFIDEKSQFCYMSLNI